ncbi:MAG: DUF2283 domain-containing protein [Candidatus Thermoplasmatota archaeon]|nr:DUF2283 domain-containing protein [Candidatus Thermoplasmatota archaeon]MBU4123957.1 DUF2283 domain-containing protein [Nanoarchaeota archaeon]
MKIHFDQEANALLIQFRNCKVAKTKEISEDIIIDLDRDDNPVAIEMLNIMSKVPLEYLSELDTNIPFKISAK